MHEKSLKPILEEIQTNIEKKKGLFKFTREESKKSKSIEKAPVAMAIGAREPPNQYWLKLRLAPATTENQARGMARGRTPPIRGPKASVYW